MRVALSDGGAWPAAGMGLNTKARAKREGILPGMLERIRIPLPQKQIRRVISGVETCKRRPQRRRLIKDKLALVTGQVLLKLAQGERQCCHFISSHKAMSLCMFSFAINSEPWCTPVICARATASLRAANSRPCS